MNIAAKKFSSDTDLRGFSHYLWQHDIPHKISEQQTQLVIWVAQPEQVQAVQSAYEAFKKMPPLQFRQTSVISSLDFGAWLTAWWLTPISLALIATAVIIFAISAPSAELAFYLQQFLLFQPVFEIDGQLAIAPLSPWQPWRFVSPIFIHANVPHLVFNCLWLWILGSRIESVSHRWQFVFICLYISIISNTAQWWLGSSPFFGGLSGLVYGLLGILLIWQRRYPRIITPLPIGLYIFMLASLVLGYTDLASWLGLGKIANTAHLAGLLCGLACAQIYQPQQKPPTLH